MKRDESSRARAMQSIAWPAFLADALRGSSRRHEDLRRRCMHKASKRSIHDLRIETRRQLALVALAGEVCGAPTDKICRSLERCMHDTTKLRDARVQLDQVEAMFPEHPELRAFRRRSRKWIDCHRADIERKLGRRKKKLSKHARSLAAVVRVPSEGRQAGLTVVHVLRAAFVDARKLSLLAHQSGEQLHRARLALKRLRYRAEALRGVVPGVTVAWTKKLHRMQGAMGDIHDLAILARRLAEYMEQRPHEGRRLRGVQIIIANREQRLLRAFQSRLPLPPTQLRRILVAL
ncbi:MAG: CHAD domain-containing protein [Opitutaceae bacterium]